LISITAGLNRRGEVVAWEHENINGGTAAIASPYGWEHERARFLYCDSPLREGSYRGIGATANNFARECFIDELAAAADRDPFAFRLDHLEDERLAAVLKAAAVRFGWTSTNRPENRGVGIAGGTEKGSYVATCVEVEVEEESEDAFKVARVCVAFECGAIQNPRNLIAQVEGAIVMGLGGALWEESRFENGRILNDRLAQYRVPRFSDMPPIETVLVDRPDLESVGAGETPIIALAPAIANALCDANGVRIRSMPLQQGYERARRSP
jgi:isoquinoline 1-oxidoreductase